MVVQEKDPPTFQHRQVDGVKVVKNEPVQSALTRPGGAPVLFRGIRLLTLDTFEQVYGCAACEFFDERRGLVRNHFKQVHPELAVKKPEPVKRVPRQRDERPGLPPEIGSMTLAELFELAGKVGHWEVLLGNLEEQNTALRSAQLTERQAHREELVAEKQAHAATRKTLVALQRKVRSLAGLVVEEGGS